MTLHYFVLGWREKIVSVLNSDTTLQCTCKKKLKPEKPSPNGSECVLRKVDICRQWDRGHNSRVQNFSRFSARNHRFFVPTDDLRQIYIPIILVPFCLDF